jgi:hypothetical protein
MSLCSCDDHSSHGEDPSCSPMLRQVRPDIHHIPGSPLLRPRITKVEPHQGDRVLINIMGGGRSPHITNFISQETLPADPQPPDDQSDGIISLGDSDSADDGRELPTIRASITGHHGSDHHSECVDTPYESRPETSADTDGLRSLAFNALNVLTSDPEKHVVNRSNHPTAVKWAPDSVGSPVYVIGKVTKNNSHVKNSMYTGDLSSSPSQPPRQSQTRDPQFLLRREWQHGSSPVMDIPDTMSLARPSPRDIDRKDAKIESTVKGVRPVTYPRRLSPPIVDDGKLCILEPSLAKFSIETSTRTMRHTGKVSFNGLHPAMSSASGTTTKAGKPYLDMANDGLPPYQPSEHSHQVLPSLRTLHDLHPSAPTPLQSSNPRDHPHSAYLDRDYSVTASSSSSASPTHLPPRSEKETVQSSISSPTTSAMPSNQGPYQLGRCSDATRCVAIETTVSSTSAPVESVLLDPSQGSNFVCGYPGCSVPPFSTQYLLNSHANVHSSSRPHYCPVVGCGRSVGGLGFKRKNEMIRHGLVHESPGYTCPFCPMRDHRYPRPDNLQR